jgi:hypothetical protein
MFTDSDDILDQQLILQYILSSSILLHLQQSYLLHQNLAKYEKNRKKKKLHAIERLMNASYKYFK